MPKQIAEQVNDNWDAANPKGNENLGPAELKKLCQTSVVNLGKLGGGDKFNAKKYTQLLKEGYDGQTEFSKKDANKIIVQLVAKAEGKEN